MYVYIYIYIDYRERERERFLVLLTIAVWGSARLGPPRVVWLHKSNASGPKSSDRIRVCVGDKR